MAIFSNLGNRPVQQRAGASGTVASNIANAAATWLVDPSAGNLHLASAVTSAVDMGQSLAGLTDDFDGQNRPLGAGRTGRITKPWPRRGTG